jgi:hypothetical protein
VGVRNKQDEYGVVTRNKDRLVAKGYAQVVGLDVDDTFTLIARLDPFSLGQKVMLKSIHILLVCATHHSFNLFQMDAKRTFQNGPIKHRKSTWNNLLGLRITGIPNLCIRPLRRSMGLSKQQERGMNALDCVN